MKVIKRSTRLRESVFSDVERIDHSSTKVEFIYDTNTQVNIDIIVDENTVTVDVESPTRSETNAFVYGSFDIAYSAAEELVTQAVFSTNDDEDAIFNRFMDSLYRDNVYEEFINDLPSNVTLEKVNNGYYFTISNMQGVTIYGDYDLNNMNLQVVDNMTGRNQEFYISDKVLRGSGRKYYQRFEEVIQDLAGMDGQPYEDIINYLEG